MYARILAALTLFAVLQATVLADALIPDPEPLPTDVTADSTLADGERPEGDLKDHVNELLKSIRSTTGVERERVVLEIIAIGGNPADKLDSELSRALKDARKDLHRAAEAGVAELEDAVDRSDFSKRVAQTKSFVPQLGIGKKADTRTMRDAIEPVINSYFPPADRLKDQAGFVEAGLELKRLGRLMEMVGGSVRFNIEKEISDAVTEAERRTFYRKLGRAQRVFAANEKYRSQLDPAEFRLIEITNVYRVVMGKSALKINIKLCRASKGHSKDMEERGFFSHDSPVPGKEKFTQRAAREGAGASSENISRAGTTGDSAFWSWFSSTGHHYNMLIMAGGQIGIGRSGSYWTELF